MLEEAATTWADLSYPDEDGTTKYQRLSHLEQATGKPHLPEIVIPLDVIYLWEWFMDLHNSRPSGFGLSPISYTELKAWTELTKIKPTPWEVQVLRRMDFCVLGLTSELSSRKTRARQSTTKKPTKRVM